MKWGGYVSLFVIALLFVADLGATYFLCSFTRTPNEGAMHGNLGSIRGDLQLYHLAEGNYPDSLNDPRFRGRFERLADLPECRTCIHKRTDEVFYLTSAQYRSGALKDEGGWAYVNEGANKGAVFINCTHTDSRGRQWSSY